MLSSLESRHPFFSGQELAAKGLMVSAERLSAVEFLLPQPWGFSLRDCRKTRPGLFEGSQKVQTQRFLLPAWQDQLYIHLHFLGNFYLLVIPVLLITLLRVQG